MPPITPTARLWPVGAGICTCSGMIIGTMGTMVHVQSTTNAEIFRSRLRRGIRWIYPETYLFPLIPFANTQLYLSHYSLPQPALRSMIRGGGGCSGRSILNPDNTELSGAQNEPGFILSGLRIEPGLSSRRWLPSNKGGV